MAGRTARNALRAARVEHGWSQSRAGAALHELAAARGGPPASAASLKTQLSRWENGHTVPEHEYRGLLAELYGRTAAELGLDTPAEPDGRSGAERLRSELAAATAVDEQGVAAWAEQLAAARRLDDRLGAAGAGGVVDALVTQLRRTLRHVLVPARAGAVAAVLAEAAVLGSEQALDQEDPEGAWRLLDVAGCAATTAGASGVGVLAGRARVLRAIGDPAAAAALLDRAGAAVEPPGAVEARLAAALGLARAALGDRPGAERALAAAERAVTVDAVRGPDSGSGLEIAAEVELGDVHRWRGGALVALHDPAAVAVLESALAAGPRSARHRAAARAELAIALAGAGRRPEAAEHARAARELAERIGSRRTVARLARVEAAP